MKNPDIRGLVAAAFTPLTANGAVDLESIPRLVEHLVADGVAALFVCGSSGEGPSLTADERARVADAFIESVGGRIPVIVHVGDNSLRNSQDLARKAAASGADAIAAVSPSYFKPSSVQVLMACLAEIAEGAPDTPFYYYHIPPLTSVKMDMADLLEQAPTRLPSLVGVKFSDPAVYEFQLLVEQFGHRFNLFYGVDEMFLAGLTVGAHGAIGSTYNFSAPLFRGIETAFRNGDLAKAADLQHKANLMIRAVLKYPANPGLKAMMKVIGVPCGGNRLPNVSLTDADVEQLARTMREIGFFDWGRGK